MGARGTPRAETYLFNDGFELGNAVLKARSLIVSVGVHFVNLIDAEGGLYILRSIH